MERVEASDSRASGLGTATGAARPLEAANRVRRHDQHPGQCGQGK